MPTREFAKTVRDFVVLALLPLEPTRERRAGWLRLLNALLDLLVVGAPATLLSWLQDQAFVPAPVYMPFGAALLVAIAAIKLQRRLDAYEQPALAITLNEGDRKEWGWYGIDRAGVFHEVYRVRVRNQSRVPMANVRLQIIEWGPQASEDLPMRLQLQDDYEWTKFTSSNNGVNLDPGEEALFNVLEKYQGQNVNSWPDERPDFPQQLDHIYVSHTNAKVARLLPDDGLKYLVLKATGRTGGIPPLPAFAMVSVNVDYRSRLVVRLKPDVQRVSGTSESLSA